mgnify:CR=1 FL=1
MIKSKNNNKNKSDLKNESIIFEHADWSVIVAHSAQAQILIILENNGKQAVLDFVHKLKQLPIPDKRIYPPMQ